MMLGLLALCCCGCCCGAGSAAAPPAVDATVTPLRLLLLLLLPPLLVWLLLTKVSPLDLLLKMPLERVLMLPCKVLRHCGAPGPAGRAATARARGRSTGMRRAKVAAKARPVVRQLR